MNIIDSPTTAPHLPRQLVYDFLFNPSPTHQVAFIDGLDGRELTKEGLIDATLRLVKSLDDLGARRGDVALIFGVNSLEWIIALFGCQAAGLVTSPANYGYTPSELLHQITDSTASIIFCDQALAKTLEAALALPSAPRIPKERIFLLTKEQQDAPYTSIKNLLRAPRSSQVRYADGDETRTAYLCYSSGTTGRAKGVETSHHNITSQLMALNKVYEPLESTDRVLGILPFSHIYGLVVVLHQPLTKGVPVVVLPRFEELSVLKAIERYRITWALIVPPILLVLLHSKNVADYDLSSLRAMQSGAAPLGVELTRSFEGKFGITVTQGYGLTETSPVTHVMTANESKTHVGQIGKLMPTFSCRLVDADTGTDVGVGKRGEMWLRGPSVMKGYWRNSEATKNTFAPGGWFKTGDIATVDEDGYFTIVDRLKEVSKSHRPN